MALVVLNSGREPLGQFDANDGYVATFKGGEFVTWGQVLMPSVGGTDKAASDVQSDGYDPYNLPPFPGGAGGVSTGTALPIGTGAASRPAIVICGNTASGLNAPQPIFLSDDGIKNYGTLFGTIVGRTVGLTSYGPNTSVSSSDLLGPSTTAGSGKVTCWDKPGLYGITLDNVNTNATSGITVTNTALGVGTPLSYDGNGLLTTYAGAVRASQAPIVGYFSEFQTNGSLVTTPQTLVAALNSPSGDVSSLQQESFYMAVFWFVGA